MGLKIDFIFYFCLFLGFYNDGKWFSFIIYDFCFYFYLMLFLFRYWGKRWYCIIIYNYKFIDGVYESFYYRCIFIVLIICCMNFVCVFSFYVFIFFWYLLIFCFMCRVDVFVCIGFFFLVFIIYVWYFIIFEFVFYKFYFVIFIIGVEMFKNWKFFVIKVVNLCKDYFFLYYLMFWL